MLCSILGGDVLTAPVPTALAVVPGGAPCRCTSTQPPTIASQVLRA
jgi:hypothetical protein